MAPGGQVPGTYAAVSAGETALKGAVLLAGRVSEVPGTSDGARRPCARHLHGYFGRRSDVSRSDPELEAGLESAWHRNYRMPIILLYFFKVTVGSNR